MIATTGPTVQYPHCTAPASMSAWRTGPGRSGPPGPSTVSISWPANPVAGRTQLSTEFPIDEHGAGAALLESAADLDVREPEPVALGERQRLVRIRLKAVRLAVDVEADRLRHAALAHRHQHLVDKGEGLGNGQQESR